MRKLIVALVAFVLSWPALGQSPGGISSNLRLWLKADMDVSGTVPVDSWTDQSPNAFVATAPGNRPSFLFDYINYYPAIDFNAANSEYMTIGSGIFGSATYTSAWVYVVGRTDRVVDQSYVFEGMLGANNSFDIIIPWSNSNTYYDFGDRNGSGRINGVWGSSINSVNFWTFGTNTTTATPSGTRKAIYRDGLPLFTSANNSSPTGNNQPFIIGGGYLDGVPTTRPFDGQISEIIIYTGVPSIQEQEQIHSYLSIKYGITKQSSDNVTTGGVDERDYFNSSGGVLWDYSVNTSYHNNISAIGTDNGSELSQAKGRSLTGNIILDAGAAMTDGSFILCGDNNTVAGTSLDVPGGYALRSNKIWKVSTSGTPGLVTLSIELDDLGIPAGLSAASYALLQDGDETFAAGATAHTAGASIVNNVLTFSGVTLTHNTYFTVAATATLKGPANVTTNLKMWLRADKNVTGVAPVSQWGDHSGNGFNATAGGSGPVVMATDANFNPALDFTSASSQYMQVAQGILGNNTYNNAWVYVVNKPDVSQNHTIFYEQAHGVTKVFDFIGPWAAGTNNMYYEFGTNNGTGRINTAWGGSFGNYYMWTLGSSTGTATPTGFRKSISRDGGVLLTNNNNDFLLGNNQPFYIAGGYNTAIPTSNMFDGKIAEMIVFTGVPTPLEQEKIQSYLAIKYGLTKNSADNVGTGEDERDYFASNGTVIVDYSAFTGYLNHFAVIGRDDASELDQRTSKGQSSVAVLTLDKGGPIPNDLDFVVAGDNLAAAGYSTDVPAGHERRINRVWRTEVVGNPGNINVSINLRELGIPFGLLPAQYSLLVDNDETFAAGGTTVTASTVTAGTATFNNVVLTGVSYLTVAYVTGALQGPGNVRDNLRLWLKADEGTSGSAPMTSWADQSGNGFVATVPANGPTLLSNTANFNPTVDFTRASSQYLQVTGGIWGTLALPNAWVYYVSRGTPGSDQTMFNENLNGRYFSSLNPWGGSNVYYMTGNNTDGQGRISGPSGLTANQYHMWTLGSSTGTATPGGTNKAISRDGNVILTTTTTDTGIGTNQNLYIGGFWQGNSGNFQDGQLAEMIVYNSVPTIQEQEKIQSYLAIKYGITKNSADNIGSPEDDRDYFASNGTVLWDYSDATAAYHNNVIVVGRDDGSLLEQVASRGASVTADLTVDRGGAFTTDLAFVAIGDNLAASGHSLDVAPAQDRRLNRIWRTQVTGSPGNVSISVNLIEKGLPFALQPTDYVLLVDADGTFAAGATAYPGATVVAGTVTFNNIPLAGVSFITVAIIDGALKGPGDVRNNLRLWMKADAGTTGTAPMASWADQSGNGYLANVPANGPDLVAGAVNFNPALDFTSANTEYLQITGGVLPPGNLPDAWTYYVMMGDGTSNQTVFNQNLTGDYFASLNPWGANVYYMTGNNTDGQGRLSGPSGLTLGRYHMWTLGSSTGTATPAGTNKAISRDGAVILTGPTTDIGASSGQSLYIGGFWQGAFQNFHDGRIAEMIVYNTVPTIQEQEKVQSYLAIKYGLMKNSADNPGSAEDERDYFSSNGTVIWDYSDNPAYHNSVTAIGRDDNSELDQRKSLGTGPTADITLDHGGAFSNDFDFVSAGDNNATIGISSDVPVGYESRITKSWRTQLTGTPGNVAISINMTDLGLPDALSASSYALLIDTDDTFADAAIVHLGASIVSGVVTFNGVTLTGTQYLTVAVVGGSLYGPGDVTSNIRLWLRADAGTTGTAPLATWLDQSGNGFQATAPGAAPDLIPNQLNFNPVLDFTRASSEYLQITGGIMRTNTFTDVWTYYVGRNHLNVNNTVLNENLAGGEYYAVLNPWSGLTYYNFGNTTSPTGGRVVGAWGGTHGDVYMWSMGTSTGMSTPSGTRKSVYRNGALTLSNDGIDTGTGNNQPLYIGGRWQGANSEYFDGEIAELVVYTGVPSPLDQEKIQSYFAIKYALAKNSVDNVGTLEDERDYFSSNGTVIWDFSDNPTFNNNIAGIGRDDNSVLDQRKSKSLYTNADLTIDKAAAFPTDHAYIVCGDNNVVYGTSTDLPAGPLTQRLSKLWRARITGAPGTVDITLDITNLGLPIGLPSAAYSLVIDSDDGVFTNASTHATGVSNTNGVISFTGVPLTDGAYFTVAYDASFLKGPGDVTNNIRLWLRANTEVTGATPVTGWGDQSGYEFNATVPANGPDLLADQANFNPALDFTRANSEHMQITGGIVKNLALPEAWVYYVSRGDASAPNQTVFSENLASTRYLAALNPYTNGVYYMTGNNVDNQGRISGPWGGTVGQYHMWTNGSSPGVGTPTGFNKAISRDGAVILTGTTTDTGSGNNQNFFIGGRWAAGTDYHDGQIAELIVYNGVPTPVEQEKVQSYLALKYGIMKNSADNGTTATVDERDYLASDETVVWDYSTYLAHHNNVIGVGRDDGSELDQRKSRSAGRANYLTIDKGGAFGSNLDFIVAGDNAVGGSLTEVPGSCVRRSGRVWRADVSGTPGPVSLTFDLANLNLPNTFPASAYRLLIDTDGNFTDATEHALGTPSVASGHYTATDVTLNEGEYFTVAMVASTFRGPGNVTQGLQLWLKAGTGVTGVTPVTQWSDQSGLDRHAVTLGNGPTLLSQEINFNPAVDFNRASVQYMAVPSGVLRSGSYTSAWAYVVSKTDLIVNQTTFFEGLGNKVFDALIPWSDGILYSELGTNNTTGRVSGAWGGNTTNYFMWTMGSSTGTATPSGARKTIYRNGTVLASNANNDSGTGTHQPFYIGGGYNAGAPTSNNFDGKIAEMIVYTSVPSVLEQEKVHSYLGIKYGIVKASIDNVSTGGTDERDYFASNGSVIWDFTNWTGYTSNTFGVGRDDGSELDQRKSKANNGNGYLTIEHTGAFSTDLSYIVCADNNASGTSTDVPLSLQKRSSRVWRADLTGTPGPVSLTFDLADLNLMPSLPVGDYVVLLDADGTFATGATSHVTGASLSSGQFTVTGVTLTEGMYISIGIIPGATRGPANVSNNLHLWLKSNMGVTGTAPVTAWADQSGFDRHANSTTSGPTLVADEFNFNPGLDFVTASTQHLIIPGGIMRSFTFNSVWTYVVSKTDVVQDNTIFWETMAGGEWFTGLIGYTGNGIYYDFGNGGGAGRINGAWGSSVGTPNIWTLAASTSTSTPNGTRRTIYRDGLAILSSANADNGTGNNSPFIIGAGYNSGSSTIRNNDGKIAELIVFNGIPTIQEQEKIHSYLAIKYGITKLSGNNGASPEDDRDYFASDGSVIWDFSVNTSYSNRIVGIGRDGELNQVTSASSLSTGILRVSNPSNLDDLEYLVMGDNNGLVNAGGVTDKPAGIFSRIARSWKTAVKGSPGTVSLRINLITAPGPKDPTHLVLLVDRNKDGLFADETVGGGGIISGATLISGETFEFSGVTLNDGELVSVGSTSGLTPLPIVLLSFEAEPVDGMIRLAWSTASELNNDYFKLHKSFDGGEFHAITRVKGQGTTSKRTDYEYYDDQSGGDIIYYRLTQVDFDGMETASKVVSVRPDQVPFDFRIVPNPAEKEITVRVFNAVDPEVWLYNAQGIRLNVPAQLTTQGFVVDVSQLAPGLYLVAVKDDGKTLVKRLVRK